MTDTEFGIAWIRKLAKRLEADIHLRGLREGDRYLTAAEAGQLLNCSTASAHRAMRVLVEKNLLARYRSQGTFVGAAAGKTSDSRITTVYVLLPAEGKDVHEARLDVLARKLRNSLPNSNVQLSFVPRDESVRYLSNLFAINDPSLDIAGVVAISCPREVYQFLAQESVSTVVLGTLYPGDPKIISLDGDHQEAGRLLTKYLVDRGHRRMAVLFPDVSRPGQNAFVDGVSEVLTAAKLPFNSMIIRSVPHEETVFPSAIKQLLELPDRPTALIVREEKFAEVCSTVAAQMSLHTPEDVEVVFRAPTIQVVNSAYTHTQPRWSFEEVSAKVGEILRQCAAGEQIEKTVIVNPMELVRGKSIRTKTKRRSGTNRSS